MVTTAQIPGSEPGALSDWKRLAAGSAAQTETGASSADLPQQRPAALSALDAATLAHRLRNPLTAIHQSVETLARSLPAGSRESELCEIALDETRRLERTVSRALRGARNLERSRVEIGGLVRRIAGRIALDPRLERGIDLQLRVDDAELFANVDPDRVSEALASLLENALDAVSQGGQIAIAVAAQHSLGVCGLRIDVRDSGAGFDERALRAGPQRFHSTKPLGLGIGLLIAREAAEAHGGFLRLRNADEGGARVSLWLPLEPVGR